jgi:SAM domain (Sterile alpha motif)
VDVGGWLKSLGLEQYEAAFRENGVSEEDLPHLTAEDLQDLGVVAVGHRRRLLVAIAKLQNDNASSQAAGPSSPSYSPSVQA